MAKQIISNPVIVLAGGTVSSSARQATISVEADDVETTNFGGSGWRERIGGLKGGTVDIEWLQDYAAGGIDATAYALVGSTASMEMSCSARMVVMRLSTPVWSATCRRR